MLYVVDVANLAFGVLHEEEEHLDVALLVLTVFLFLVDLGAWLSSPCQRLCRGRNVESPRRVIVS